jgi:hypothetical protein
MSRLRDDSILWLGTTRATGAPHVTPIWFVWHDDRVWICTRSVNLKARALRRDPRVSIALGTGAHPLVGEGRATDHARPYPPAVRDAFVAKYDWNIDVDDEDGVHDVLFEIVIDRWVLGAPTD